MDKLGKILSIEEKESDKGGYLQIWWLQEGDEAPRKQSLFKPDLIKTARDNINVPIAATFEKKEGSKFWNIIAFKDPDEVAAPSKDNGQVRDSSTNVSIESQVAYKGIIDLMLGEILPPVHWVSVGALKWASDKMGFEYNPPTEAPSIPPERAKSAKKQGVKTKTDVTITQGEIDTLCKLLNCDALDLTARAMEKYDPNLMYGLSDISQIKSETAQAWIKELEGAE